MIIIILLCILVFILLFLIFKKSENFSQIEKHNFKYDDKNKLKIYDECKFSGDGFGSNHELGECSIALQKCFRNRGGAGKVSHMINKILKERNLQKNHIVIEPGNARYIVNENDSFVIKKNNKI